MSARLIAVSLLAVLSLAACSGPSRHDGPGRERPQVAVTPNGEPLPLVPGPDGCQTALAGWFAKADRNNDGVLDQAEILADAEQWFARADLDRSGEITADELTAIRLRINPLPELEPESQPGMRGGPGGPGGPGGGHDRMTSGRSQSQVDPVMAADANADFRVTRAEFLAHVTARIQAQPGGVLTAAKVQENCRQDRR